MISPIAVIIAVLISLGNAVLIIGFLTMKSVNINSDDDSVIFGYRKDKPVSVYERKDFVDKTTYYNIIKEHSEE